MKHTLTKDSDTRATITITLDAKELDVIKRQTLGKLAKKIKVSGFRPGKVPANVAEKNIDPSNLNAQLVEDAVNKHTIDAFTAEGVQPLDRPQVDVTKFVPGEMLEFTVAVDILPEIKLGNYKNLKAKKTVEKVEEKDIDEVIERMRSGMAEKKTVDRVAKKDDEVSMDFEGKDEEGNSVGGASGKDYPLVLGSGNFIPGFEEGLIGKKAGEHFDLPLTFPKEYHHKPIAGAKVTFTVDVKEVKEVVEPKVDDKFAAKCGPFKTVVELRDDIKRELSAQKEREAHDKLKDALIEQLVKNSEIPVPDVLINDQVANLERDITQSLLYRGMTLQQYLEELKLTKDEWRDKELRSQAIRRVQVGLVLAELSKIEKIEITHQDLEARMQEYMQQYGNNEEMRKQLDTPEARRDLANRVLTEKTVDRLVELNS